MRIVHVEDRFEPDAGYQINEMIKLHATNGHEVFVVTSKKAIFSTDDTLTIGDKNLLEKYNIKVIRLSHWLIISSRYLFKSLFKTIEKLNPDIVFMHGIGDFKDLILLKPKRKYTIVRDCHMSWVASQNKFNKIYYKVFKYTFAKYINKTNKYAAIYSLGDEETEYLKTLGIKDKKIKFLLHGYNKNDMFFSEKERETIRSELDYSSADVCIGYVGKFDNNKAPHYIFNILGNLDEDFFINNRIKLLFIGPKDKTYYSIFESHMNNFKYRKFCTVLDGKPYKELYKYFSALDIVIWPKECTLSSIHAQVCRCRVVMENHLSNKERVYFKEELFDRDDYIQASNIIKDIVENKKYYKNKNEDLNKFIEKREYIKQIKQLEKEWNHIIDSKI